MTVTAEQLQSQAAVSRNLLSKKQLLNKVPLSERHISNLEKDGKFPKRIVLSARCVAWVESEVDQWIEERRASNDKAMCPMADQEATA